MCLMGGGAGKTVCVYNNFASSPPPLHTQFSISGLLVLCSVTTLTILSAILPVVHEHV